MSTETLAQFRDRQRTQARREAAHYAAGDYRARCDRDHLLCHEADGPWNR